MLRAEVSDGDAVITLWGRRARAAVRVKDIAFKSRNYFMGGRRARATVCRLHHYHTYSMQLHGEISFLRCICSYIIIMQYHTNRGCTVVDQVSMLDRHSSGLGFKSRTWLKFDSRFQPCVFPQASSAIM